VTANFLNSEVYCCFGIFIVSPFMVTAIIRHPWKTKFRGKLKLLQLGHTQSIGSALFLGLADMAQTEWEWLMTDRDHVAGKR